MGREPSKPCVVVVSGSVGSGKTALVERLAGLLGDAPALIFDHYDRYAEWPQDLDGWIRAGADPNQVRVPRLKEDLLSLLEGTSITHPLDDRVVNPSEYILIEEPFGRERREIAEYVDLVVHVDVPQDVCAIRVSQRALGMADTDLERTVEGESREELVRRVQTVAFWSAHYMRMRSAYTGVSSAVKRKADIVVDGMKPVDEIAQAVLDALKTVQGQLSGHSCGGRRHVEAYRGFLKSDRWEEWKSAETDQRNGTPPPPLQKPYPENATLIDLFAPDDLTVGQMPVIEAIRQRRSRREFSKEPLGLEELSFLLWATQGIDEEATQAFRDWLAEVMDIDRAQIATTLRTVPSGGGCHPFETYLLVNRVNGLESGLYRYLSVEHKLLLLYADTELTVRAADAVAGWAVMSAVVFVWTTIPYRTEWRYSIVSHKMIAQESGHLCQNLYLACEAIGAGACVVGAYDQAEMDAILGVDGQDEFVIAVVPVGKVAS